jgi:hypothetical protein
MDMAVDRFANPGICVSPAVIEAQKLSDQAIPVLKAPAAVSRVVSAFH